MMKNNTYIFITTFLLLFVLLFFTNRCMQGDIETILRTEKDRDISEGRTILPSHVKIDQKRKVSKFLDAFETPIELHGKVIDQHGAPVSGASITLTPTDSPFGDGSRSKTVIFSDAEGKFSVKGLKGASMGVRAEKEDYMPIPRMGGPASSSTVEYTGDAQTGKIHTNPATPLILKLHKVGPTDPIIYVGKKRWRLPADGTTVKIALDSDKGIGDHQIEFRFWSDWNKLPKNNEMYGKLYNWTFEAQITGGGFIWNDEDFNFEAPEFGYKEMIRYDNPSNLTREQWKRVQSGRYFVKFPDGTHARIEFSIDGSSDLRPLSMASWMNLKPGSRNLASPLKGSHLFQGDDPELK